MTLTIGNAPLGTAPTLPSNYRVDGPAHRLLATPFPRRVRARFAGETVLDTTDGVLVHESNLLPVLYVPDADIATDLLSPSDHTTHCPFKGDAAYHSIRVGSRIAENAVWSYPRPHDDTPWLAGLMACYWGSLDEWLDEDEVVRGHLRDPFHRVDVRTTSRHVRVLVDADVVADTTDAVVLSENGLPNRWYLPTADVATERFTASDTRTHCPYKGDASYHHHGAGEARLADAVFAYEEPFECAGAIAGHWCFIPGDRVTVEVDGAPLAA